MQDPFELKLSEDETYSLVKRLTDFYTELDTIEKYFIERKKEKIDGIDHDKYIKDMFNDYNMEPNDMDFELEVISGTLFNPMTQITISLPLESQIGRQIMIGVKEKNSNKYVGFIRVASPVLTIKPRNSFFGETVKATSVNKFMVNGAIIVPIQPFGYNYLGGKLLSLICCSHEMRDMLKEKYGENIEPYFFETTSLYGDIKGVSQYDGLKPFIRYQDMTESDIFLFPTENIYDPIRRRIRELYGKAEWNGNIVDPKPSGPKMREFNKMISILKNHLKHFDLEKHLEFNKFTKEKMKAKTKKRYYYSTFGYDNVKEHINSDGEIPVKKGQNYNKHSLASMVEWWKVKAQRRYETLKEKDIVRHKLEVYTKDTIDNKHFEMIR